MSDSALNPELISARYPNVTEGDALFFKPSCHGKPAFRFEVPDVGYEFSSGSEIGSEISGTFYYKNGVFGEKLPPRRATKADFAVHRTRDESEVQWVHIEFFAPGSQHELLGEFRGVDRDNALGDSESLHGRHEGIWKEVDYIITTSSLNKADYSQHITLTAESLGKRATFVCKPKDILYRLGFNLYGRLTLKDFSSLERSTWASWDHDHVVFHDDNDPDDFTAFYFPDQTQVADDRVVFRDIVWTNI